MRDYDSYFRQSLETFGTLAEMVRKQLACEPFTEAEEWFLQQTIKKGDPQGYGAPSLSGWYADLCFDPMLSVEWKPTVADVHTAPGSLSVLEVAVGNVELCVMIADSKDGKVAHVGPVFTY